MNNNIIMNNYDFRFSQDHVLDPKDRDIVFCCICKCIINKPVETICGHLFCLSCITSAISNNMFACPLCRTYMSSNFNSIFLERYIAGVKVKCCNDECTDIYTIAEISNHIKYKCLYEPVQCIYCSDQIIRKDYIIHKEACGKRLIKCVKCNNEIEKKHEILHSSECMELIIDCKYAKCLLCPFKAERKNVLVHENDHKFHLDLILDRKKFDKFAVGMYIDVLDKFQHFSRWEPAIIIDQTDKKILVKYLRWTDKWNEWLDIESDKSRISPFTSNQYDQANREFLFNDFLTRLQTIKKKST